MMSDQPGSRPNQVVRIVADVYPPYQFEANGSVKGADYEIVTGSLTRAGIQTTTQLLPWETCLDMMRRQEADAIFQITRTPERERDFLFSKTFRTEKTLFFKRADTVLAPGATKEINSLLATHTLGVLSGFSYGAIVDDAPAARIEVARHDELLNGLVERRFELALIDQSVAAYLVARIGVGDIEPVPRLKIERDLHFAARTSLPWLVEAFERGLGDLSRSGDYDAILRRYGISAASRREAPDD
jgi:polar amino acid transport system substrate-binding protein